jgi:hypothetical protein
MYYSLKASVPALSVPARLKPGQACRAVTLVEVLVLLGIIGLLMAILLPAVQAAREAARRSQCGNNLKQLSLGAQCHVDVHKFFPAGGWGWAWAGDPNYGFDQRQPGGWMYNILPFIEESALHDLGKDLMPENGALRRAAIRQAVETVVPLYFCPARRSARAIRHSGPRYSFNLGETHVPRVVGRNDYSACAGDVVGDFCMGPVRYVEWELYSCWNSENNRKMNGITVLGPNGMIGPKKITDGMSKTILYGEKWLKVVTYETFDYNNDQGWNIGHDSDVNSWCDGVPSHDGERNVHLHGFGSAHPAGMQCTMADGSVHTIPYDVGLEVFRRLGVRNDGLPLQSQSRLEP